MKILFRAVWPVLVFASNLFLGCTLVEERTKKESSLGLIVTPPSYYTTIRARYLGEKYKENLQRLVERVVQNPVTGKLQFANNIASLGGIGFFTHSATKSADERYLEVMLGAPDVFDDQTDLDSKMERLFSQYGSELLNVLTADSQIYNDKEVAGYGLNFSWRNTSQSPSGPRVTLERAVIYISKSDVQRFLNRQLVQNDLLSGSVIFALQEEGPARLVSYPSKTAKTVAQGPKESSGQEIERTPDITSKIREQDLPAQRREERKSAKASGQEQAAKRQEDARKREETAKRTEELKRQEEVKRLQEAKRAEAAKLAELKEQEEEAKRAEAAERAEITKQEELKKREEAAKRAEEARRQEEAERVQSAKQAEIQKQEETRRGDEAKQKQEEAKRTEATKLAEIARQEELKKRDEAAKWTEEAKRQEEAKRAEVAKLAELKRQEEEAKRAEAAKLAEIAKQEELKRREEAAKRAEEAKRQEEAKRAEAAKLAELKRQEEEAKRAEAAKLAEIAKQEELKRREEAARRAEEARRQEEARRTELAKKKEEQLALKSKEELSPFKSPLIRDSAPQTGVKGSAEKEIKAEGPGTSTATLKPSSPSGPMASLTPTAPFYVVQLSFIGKEEAQRWSDRLRKEGYSTSMSLAGEGEAIRLRVGSFPSHDDASRVLGKLRGDGIKGIVVQAAN
jgi:cell division protein FtsN